MKVLVLGASGFIGLPVAQALSRAGYIVYGQTRSAEKAKQLAADEITPIVGESGSSACLALVPTLDVVIHALGGSTPESNKALFETYSIAARNSRPSQAPKLTYIFTSGTWAHGDNRYDIVTDGTPVTSPTDLCAQLPGQEQTLVTSTSLNGIVIRPAMIYGRGGSIFSILFNEALVAKKECRKISVPGTTGGRYAIIHQDDLADLYVRVAERAPILGGLILDASNDQTVSVDDFFMRLSQLVGASGYEYRQPANAFEASVASTSIVRPYLAKAIVGWVPRKPSLVDNLSSYFAAFLASKE